jgi:mRNA-degrading endonuclease RelE of RelBE toxin-antitoxin system
VHPPAYRLRVGDFRVLFALAPDRVEVERVVNRRDAY